jgi:intron-binding protein aquarius
LTNIASIDKRETLLKQLGGLSAERLYALAEYIHIVPYSGCSVIGNESSAENQPPVTNPHLKHYSKQFLLEIIIGHMEKRRSQLSEINSLPLYASEQVIWDENIVPSEFKQTAFNDTSLALPKLNLKFLTLHDYLWRNFQLFRLESAYELRQDIEDAVVRSRPYYSFEDQTVCFAGWSRMAQPVINFSIADVGKPRVGEDKPSHVRANLTVDLELCRDDVRQEWDALRKHDIGFLVTLKPSNTLEQKYDPKDSFLRQTGLLYVRGCEIEGKFLFIIK